MKIWIETKGDNLRLRWRHEGKRYCIGLGVKDTHTGRALARQKMSVIEMDIMSGHFDTTLLKYRPRKLGKNPSEITAVELIEKYTADRRDSLANGSIVRLKAISSKLSRLLGDKPAEKVTESVARDAIARWSETASSGSIKTYLFLLRACWDWAKGKYHIGESNPWSVCLERSRSANEPEQKNPFAIAELQTIIAAFRANKYYRHYSDFVVFLAGTGCRPGEAAALTWKDIESERSTARICKSISRGHQNLRGTKTGKSRTIQLPPSVRSMLIERFAHLKPQQENLVFPAPKGGAIDDHNFSKRIWTTVLSGCGVEYRSPYNLRHTAISHALNTGVNPIALAEQTGHDKKTMLSTYAHAIGRDCLFVDLKL